jgi:hypothetical protein
MTQASNSMTYALGIDITHPGFETSRGRRQPSVQIIPQTWTTIAGRRKSMDVDRGRSWNV